MKLLATDYDGTFKSDIKNLVINTIVVEKFMNKGNKFAIVTGRCFNSMKQEIKKYNIKYDYLVCNNGLTIFDNEDNLIYSSMLNADAKNIYEYLMQYKDINIISLYDTYCTTNNFENILEIYVKFKNKNTALKCKEDIEKMYDSISCYCDNKKIFIGNKDTKATAVSFIMERENLNKEDIYTVGDNRNDLEMLKEFNGYKVLFSYPNMWLEKLPMTREVHTLVKKLNKDSR